MPKGELKGEQDFVPIDFSGVTPFEPLDEARIYLTQVSALVPGTGPSGGKVRAELTVQKPEEIEVEVEGKVTTLKTKGRKLFREYSLLPQSLPYFYEFLRAVDPNVVLGKDFKFKPSDYVGLECAVRVQNEEYDEQIRSKVRKVLPASAFQA